MQIRPYHPCDLLNIVKLDRVCFHDAWSKNNWQGTMEMEQYACFVMEQEEEKQLEGFILISFAGEEGELLKIGVDPACRKQGIGDRLLKEAVMCWRERGVIEVFLEARQSNLPARTLYENNDFKEIGLRKNYYTDPKEHAVIYQKMITDGM